MRKIFINTICGGGLGFVLSPITDPVFWVGMVCFAVAIINSQID